MISETTDAGDRITLRRVLAVIRQVLSPNCEAGQADGVKRMGSPGWMFGIQDDFAPHENKRLPDDVAPRPSA